MSSNIRINRICKFCNEEFIAKTTKTQYCGDSCAKRAYKARKRVGKIEASNKETIKTKIRPIEVLKAKDFLTVVEACELLSVSRWTIWRSIKRGELNAAKLGRRVIIRRSDIEKLFE